MDLAGEMMDVKHKVDSEDLVHCDLMAICTFFVAILMKGLCYKQAVTVVNRIGGYRKELSHRWVQEGVVA